MKEGDVKKDCYNYMLALPMCHPIDTPNFPGRNRQKVKQRGVADLHCCYYGRYVAVENKFGDNGQSSFQKTYQSDIESSGGFYILAYTLDDLIAGLENVKNQL